MGGEDRGAHAGHHAVALRAQRIKVFCPAFLQKSGRGPGEEPLAARRSARNSLVLHKAQEGAKGGTLAGGSPFAGGPAARGWVLAGRNSPFCWRLSLPFAAYPPHFFGLAQRNGVEPQRKALGWWRPREVSGPTRLSHSRGRCHSAAKVSASRTDCITRPRGEGLGLDVDWRLKVFCPAFLQKSGRGPGAEPLGVSLCSQSAGGGQRGNPRRGFPICGRPRRPQPLRFADVRSHPTPGGGGTPPLRGAGGTGRGWWRV